MRFMTIGHATLQDALWTITLLDIPAKILEQERIRMIGICFGHQIVERAMGVKVGRNDDG